MHLLTFVASIKVQADKGLGWEDICVRLKIDAAETQRAVRRIVLEHRHGNYIGAGQTIDQYVPSLRRRDRGEAKR